MQQATRSFQSKRKARSKPSSERPGRTRFDALWELLRGAALYGLCISLPTFIGVAVRFYNVNVNTAGRGFGEYIMADSSSGSHESMSVGGPHSTTSNFLFTEHYTEHINWYYDQATSYVCSSSLGEYSGWCDTDPNSDVGVDGTTDAPLSDGETNRRKATKSDSIPGISADIRFVAILSIALATIRVWLVHLLVPRYLAPVRLAALVKCKSTHLLSSSNSYQLTPNRDKPTLDLSALGRESKGFSSSSVIATAKTELQIPNLPDLGNDTTNEPDDDGDSWFFVKEETKLPVRRQGSDSLDDRRDYWKAAGDNDDVATKPLMAPGSPAAVQRLGGGGEAVTDSDSNRSSVMDRVGKRVRRSSEVASGILTSTRHSFHRALGHESVAPYQELDATATIRLFSAPRYATAIFRLLYCSVSCATALAMFRSADFWPVYLGGNPNSSTRNCWDLSGGVMLGSLDSDFDHRNESLRLFFLAQASYQIHSLCFHLFSMSLLLVYGGKPDGGDGRLVSMKSSTESYLRPLAEHLIVLTLILGSYVFSSLRRLGAVGIFTLEFSSVFLQLLQVSLNAPETSWLRKPSVVKFVHRFVVIPTFTYSRFFVLPFVVWYSALFESQDWLDQIEKAFVPGLAEAIYFIFNGFIMLIFSLNLVFFRRLLHHPYLKRISEER